MICTRCGSARHRAVDAGKGSGCLELILWCSFVVPGVIYHIWRKNSEGKVCPACGSVEIVPLDSPAGIALQQKFGTSLPATDPEVDSTRTGYKVLAGIFGVILIAVGISNMHDQAPPPAVPPPTKKTAPRSIEVGVMFNGTDFVVMNSLPTELRDVRLSFQSGGDSWFTSYGRIAKRSSVSIPARSFRTSAGNRFGARAGNPSSIHVSAHGSGGEIVEGETKPSILR